MCAIAQRRISRTQIVEERHLASSLNARPNPRPAGASMTTIRSTALAIGLAAMCAAGLTAQSQETQTTTKNQTEIKGGKNVTMIGCLERRSDGGYVLTEVRDNRRNEHSRYALITSKDLSRHV